MTDMKNMSQKEFIAWNEAMIRKHSPEDFHHSPNLLIRWVEACRVKKILRLLDAKKEDWVLEVGLGCGHILNRVPTGRLAGTDIAETAMASSRARLASRAILFRSDAQHLPVRGGSFGKVYCSEVLEHLPDPRRALEEMARILSPGGRLVISIPNEELILKIKTLLVRLRLFDFFLRTRHYSAAERERDEWHLHAFNLPLLREILPANLEIKKTVAVPFFFLPLRYVVELRAAGQKARVTG